MEHLQLIELGLLNNLKMKMIHLYNYDQTDLSAWDDSGSQKDKYHSISGT